MVPFLKWPGGKRWFATHHADRLPAEYGTYVEPFLGSGSVFFHLAPRVAVLADTNRELVDTYRAIRDDPAGVRRHLRRHHRRHTAEHYYATRAARMRTAVTRAARFVYLNRTCFNGIYRVNLEGTFNVPIGTKSAVVLDTDDFPAVSRRLRRAELLVDDFEVVVDRAVSGDLVFADPPYTVRHNNNNGFVKYNEKLFSWSDQERLARALFRAACRGVKVVATNADHGEIRKLYPQRTFSLQPVERYSSISSSSASRRVYRELIVRTNCE